MTNEANIELCPEYYVYFYTSEDSETHREMFSYERFRDTYEIYINYSSIIDGVERGCTPKIILAGVVEVICYPFLYIVK